MEEKHKKNTRASEVREYVAHVVSLSLSVALAQMWAGFVLKTGARLLGKTGLGQPTDDYRSLAIVTLFLVLLLLTFDNMELHKVAGGVAAAPYL